MDAEPFTAIAARTLPRPLGRALAVGGAFLLLPMILLAFSANASLAGALGVGGTMGSALGLLAFFATYMLSRSKETQAPLRMNGDVLEHGGLPIAKRGDVQDGHAWEASDGAHVQLGKKVHLRLARLVDARALLAAMGVDASKKAARFRIRAPSKANQDARMWAVMLTMPLSLALAIGLQKITGHVTPGIVYMLPYLLAVGAAMIQGHVRVGADGVLVKWLWHRRFIPHSEIETVTPTERSMLGRRSMGVRITLLGGESIDVAVAAPSRGAAALDGGRAEVQTIIERIEEAREVARGGGGVEAAHVLGRDGRSAADWLAGLRAAFGGAEGFRGGPPLTNEQLWRAVEDPDARPWLRAAAAAALAVTVEPEERTRLRVAAAATVAPRLRLALDAAASADDAKLAEALESIEDDEPKEARRA